MLGVLDSPVWISGRGEADVGLMGGGEHCFDRLVCHCDCLRESRGQTADIYFLTASDVLAPGSL